MACVCHHWGRTILKWNLPFVQASRFGSSWKRKVLKREFDDTVFQYVGENAKRADRLYGWGCSATGALGMVILNLVFLFLVCSELRLYLLEFVYHSKCV